MTASTRLFMTGFFATLALFLCANLLAAQLQSDCGLPAFFHMAGCADDIRRAGFPLQFYEEGGFDGRRRFDGATLAADIIIGMALGVAGGWVGRQAGGGRETRKE